MRKRKNSIITTIKRHISRSIEPLLTSLWVLLMSGLAIYVLSIWVFAL